MMLPEQVPTIMHDKDEIFSLIQLAVSQHASDLHLSMGLPPHVRINGKLTPIAGHPALTAGYLEKLIMMLLTPEQKERLKEKRELDFSYIYKDQAFLRCSAFYQKNTLSCVMRIISPRIKSWRELGLPESVAKLFTYKSGLILVVGPTGSGKSTTLAAMIEEINRVSSNHIITVEDPIEYVFTPKMSLINQREVGSDTLSYQNALKSALREDFDVIMIGELRDLESIEAAMQIAEAGHLVFATVHAGDAASTPDRIVNVFPPYYQQQVRTQLSSVLIGVVAQRLIPRTDGSGRIPVVELMLANQAVRTMIREGKGNQLKSIIETGRSEGMVTFEQSLAEMVKAGMIQESTIRTFF